MTLVSTPMSVDYSFPKSKIRQNINILAIIRRVPTSLDFDLN